MVTTQTESVLRGSPYRADCPTRRILDRIGDRWTVLIVGALWDGSVRFSELRRRVEGVSQKMLTQTLRGSNGTGSCAAPLPRSSGPRGVALRAGLTLREPLRALEEWSIAHLGDVAASQEAYDRADRPPQDSPNRAQVTPAHRHQADGAMAPNPGCSTPGMPARLAKVDQGVGTFSSFGDSDVVTVLDLPDNTTAAGVALLVAASGTVDIKTTVLLTPEEVDAAVKIGGEYRPPGG